MDQLYYLYEVNSALIHFIIVMQSCGFCDQLLVNFNLVRLQYLNNHLPKIQTLIVAKAVKIIRFTYLNLVSICPIAVE